MKKIIAALAFFAFAQASVAEDAYAFKGWKLDEQISNMNMTGLLCSKGNGIIADKQCIEKAYKSSETIAGAPIQFMVLFFFDDVLSSIAIREDEKYFNQIRDAMIEKYGKPTSENNEPIQNRAGASFDNSILEWDNSVSKIQLKRRSGKIDASSIVYSSKSGLAESGKRSKQNAASGSHDL